MRDRPWASAADLFPSAAAANRPIFYKNGGAERTVAEVLDNLRATANRQAPAVSQHELGDEPAHLFGPKAYAAGTIDRALASRLMANLLENDYLNGQPNDFMRMLGQVADGNDKSLASLNPTMLAQLYGAGDQKQEEAGLDVIQSLMGMKSIAQILSPDGPDKRSGDDSSLGFDLKAPI